MDDRRRAPRVSFEADELVVDLRVVGLPQVVNGRLVDASDLGFFVELDHPVVVSEGDEVVIKIRSDGAAKRLKVEGITSPAIVRRKVSSVRLGLEAPSLTARVRQELADLIWERQFMRKVA